MPALGRTDKRRIDNREVQRETKKGPRVQRPAAPTGPSGETKTDQRRGTLHPGSPPLPFLPSHEWTPWPSISAGAEQQGSAPAPTKAPLRSSHWSGRPNNHLAQRVWCLYPGGRVVLASRNFQHAAELGYAPLHRARPARMVRSLLSFRARSLSLFQVLCVQEDRLISKRFEAVKSRYSVFRNRRVQSHAAVGVDCRGGRITTGTGFGKASSTTGAERACSYYNFFVL